MCSMKRLMDENFVMVSRDHFTQAQAKKSDNVMFCGLSTRRIPNTCPAS